MFPYSNLNRDTGPTARDSDCPICQVPFSPCDTTLIHNTGCDRTFHAACLLPWLNGLFGRGEKITCPMCRGDIPPAARLQKILKELSHIERVTLRRFHEDPTGFANADPIPRLRARARLLVRDVRKWYPEVDVQALNNRLESARLRRNYTANRLQVPVTSQPQSSSPQPSGSTSTRSAEGSRTEDREEQRAAIVRELIKMRAEIFGNPEHMDGQDGLINPELIEQTRERLLVLLRSYPHATRVLREQLNDVMNDIYIIFPEQPSDS